MEKEEMKPYPTLDGTCPNCRLVCEVTHIHACKLNSVSEYIYQSIMFRDVMPELSEIFDDIAMDEMIHFTNLGELIKRLGGDPVPRTAIRGRGGLVMRQDKGCRGPVMAAREINKNISDEKRSRNECLRLAAMSDRMGQLPASALFRRIAEDEQQHQVLQENLLK